GCLGLALFFRSTHRTPCGTRSSSKRSIVTLAGRAGMRLFASSRRKKRSRHSSRSSTYHTSFSNRPCDTVFHTPSPVSHEQIRATEYPASHALAVPSVKREHTHKVAQLHVDTRKADYL